MNNKKVLWIVIGITAGIFCLAACAVVFVLFQVGSFVSRSSQSVSLVGNAAPDFTLVSLDGETMRLSEMLDQPVFLCFGTTWCPDCKKEAPLLQELHEKHPDVNVIWVDSKEDSDVIAEFLSSEGLTFTTLVDPDGSVAQEYMVWAVPTTFVIDTDGIIKARFVERITQQQVDDTLSNLGGEK